MTRRRRLLATSMLATLLLLVPTVLAPIPAFAGGGVFVVNVWVPALNGSGNVFSKAQTKVLSGPTPDDLQIIVCVVAWDGSNYFQLGQCVHGTLQHVLQITRNKTIAGGCNHGVRYGTKARGILEDNGVTYPEPQPLGTWKYAPQTGGLLLC